MPHNSAQHSIRVLLPAFLVDPLADPSHSHADPTQLSTYRSSLASSHAPEQRALCLAKMTSHRCYQGSSYAHCCWCRASSRVPGRRGRCLAAMRSCACAFLASICWTCCEWDCGCGCGSDRCGGVKRLRRCCGCRRLCSWLW